MASKDQLRMATSLECAANDTIAQDAVLTAGEQSETKMYQDITQISEIPGIRRRIQKIKKRGWPKGKPRGSKKIRPLNVNPEVTEHWDDCE